MGDKITELPWTIEAVEREEYWFAGKHYNVNGAVGIETLEEAKFIVKAVNNHESLVAQVDMLVEALELISKIDGEATRGQGAVYSVAQKALNNLEGK